jgi:DNA-binding transcriptional LysR family regulator
MDWDQVRVFLSVARTGRMSASARELGVEHTTIGRRLDALERDLGVRLFYRTASGFRLTAEGESALANAESMERAALALGARARESSGKVAGTVRIALLEEWASCWLAPKIPEFRERHPQIDLQLVVGIPPVDIARGDAELAIRTPKPRQAGLSAVQLARTSTGLYAAKALLGGKRMRVTDLASARGLPLLVYAAQFHLLQSAAWMQPILAGSEIALRTNSTITLLAAARASAGIAVLPRIVARPHDDLVAVSDDLAVGEAWLVTHPEFRRDPKVRAAADFLKRAAKGPQGLC